MGESSAIERREGDALSQIVGTGDTQALLEQVERNVRAIIDVARARGFVRRYGEGQHEYFGEPAWALLGMTYGLVPYIEWTRPVDNGWEARAVLRTRDGQEVAAAEAMCTRTEPNRRSASDHVLRAMAQTRARRNALRSALGAALVLAGFDFPDPDAPATPAQIGVLHQLERDLGWTHEQAHAMAGVESYKDLTRDQAAELIDTWTALRGSAGGVGPVEGETARGSVQGQAREVGEGSASASRAEPRVTRDDEPATEEQWERAVRLHGSRARVLRMVRERYPHVTRASEVTRSQLAEVMFG